MDFSYKPKRASAIVTGIVLITFPSLFMHSPLLLSQLIEQKPQASAHAQPSKKANKTPKTLREGNSIRIGIATVTIKKVGRNSVVLHVRDPTNQYTPDETITAEPGRMLNLSHGEYYLCIRSLDKRGGVVIRVVGNY
jgi:hypothetical protein